MRGPARLQEVIEILEDIRVAARDEGAAADAIVRRHFRGRRYIGAKDRAAIRDLVWRAIRHAGERPVSGRAALLGLLEAEDPKALALFDGSERAPAPPAPEEPRAPPSRAPAWLMPELAERFGPALEGELAALLGRAPLDIRVNRLAGRPVAEVAAALPCPSEPVRIAGIPLPDALRLPAGALGETHPLFATGVIAVQDAGSQLVAALAAARPGTEVVDLCAGAGGKTLALAAAMEGRGRILATDTDRKRLAALGPRAVRAGCLSMIETRLLDPGREPEQLADWQSRADLVLVDAPCSGSGTWRRHPELRWRLTPERLDRLVALQARLLRLGHRLVRPGGRLVYAVCSVLPREGQGVVTAFAAETGVPPAATLALSPGSHGCDGFFIASFDPPC